MMNSSLNNPNYIRLNVTKNITLSNGGTVPKDGIIVAYLGIGHLNTSSVKINNIEVLQGKYTWGDNYGFGVTVPFFANAGDIISWSGMDKVLLYPYGD